MFPLPKMAIFESLELVNICSRQERIKIADGICFFNCSVMSDSL